MRAYYIIALVLLGVATLLASLANDARENANYARENVATLQSESQQLTAEIAKVEQIEPAPLRFSSDALAEFVSRTVEAGEVLGAGVRVQPRDTNGYGAQALSFQPFRQGLEVCQASLQAGLEASGAAAILAMFEEELADLPIAVRKVTARNMNDTVVLSMDVDVFGRTP